MTKTTARGFDGLLVPLFGKWYVWHWNAEKNCWTLTRTEEVTTDDDG